MPTFGATVTSHNSSGIVTSDVTMPEDVYDALLRLAEVHKRQVCECENCTPEKAFPYDDCGCGNDWSSCSEDVEEIRAWLSRQAPAERSC